MRTVKTVIYSCLFILRIMANVQHLLQKKAIDVHILTLHIIFAFNISYLICILFFIYSFTHLEAITILVVHTMTIMEILIYSKTSLFGFEKNCFQITNYLN